MATIYDVAKLAGVSPATVSRVMNGVTVSPDLAEAVRSAAKELNYTANRTARALRNRNSQVIALIIPDIENPFFTSLGRGVEDLAQASGYSVVLCNSDEDVTKESRYIDIALSENMAGIILAPASDRSDLSALVSRNHPVVAVDRGPHGFNIDAVTLDSHGAGAAATTALLARGFRRVACITGPQDVETAQQRSAGWSDVVQPRGQHPLGPDELLLHANYRVDGGFLAMRELLAMTNPPDAVVVANNLMGAGALQALREAGLSPNEVGLAVLGDLPYASLAMSGAVVIDLPARQLGVVATTLLMERIDGDTQPARTVVLPIET